MTCQQSVYQWRDELRTHLPHLSRPQAWGLAAWSLGTIFTRHCSLSFVTLFLAQALEQPTNTLRQRLREWYWDADHKKGEHRRQLEVEDCFAPLLTWVLHYWHGSQLVLVLDATALGEHLVVLCISVVYRGSAIPVAWHVVIPQEHEKWRPHWLRLLRRLRSSLATITPALEVLVLADRGLYATWLFRRIVRLGWHPYLRVNGNTTFRRSGSRHQELMSSLARRLEGCGSVQGVAFQGKRRLACTLTIYQEEGCKEPWLVLTDLAPEQCQGCWYGLRAWIEHGFKCLKREGWQWQRTRMESPERVQRIWLVLAVATLWVQVTGSAGDEVDECADAKQLESVWTETSSPTQTSNHQSKAVRSATSLNRENSLRKPSDRQVSLFRRGLVQLLVDLWRGLAPSLQALDNIHLKPEPWPSPRAPNLACP